MFKGVDDLIKYFQKYKSFVNFKTAKHKKGSKGYGFLFLSDPEDVQRATSSEHRILGKIVSSPPDF